MLHYKLSHCPVNHEELYYKDLPHLILVPYVIWLERNNHHCNGYRPSHLHSRKRESNPRLLNRVLFLSVLDLPDQREKKTSIFGFGHPSMDNQGDTDCPTVIQQKEAYPTFSLVRALSDPSKTMQMRGKRELASLCSGLQNLLL